MQRSASKNSAQSSTIENHQHLLSVKGSTKAKGFEKELVRMMGDGEAKRIGDSELYDKRSILGSCLKK